MRATDASAPVPTEPCRACGGSGRVPLCCPRETERPFLVRGRRVCARCLQDALGRPWNPPVEVN
jgi:hypothetical protein